MDKIDEIMTYDPTRNFILTETRNLKIAGAKIIVQSRKIWCYLVQHMDMQFNTN